MASTSSSLTTLIDQLQQSTGAIKSKGNQITAQSQGLDSAAVFQLVGAALSNLQDQINNGRRGVVGLANFVSNNSGGSGSTSIQEVTLTTSTTNIMPTVVPTVGALLTVVITEDGTGNRQITWQPAPGGFKGVTVDDIDTRASKINIYLFVGRSDGNWWLIASNLGL